MTETKKPVIKVNKLFQLGIVVRDLQKAMELYEDLLGIDDWAEMEILSEYFDSMESNGEPVEDACFLAAMADVGDLQLELIQHVKGNLPYGEFLEEHGEGLHHVGHIHVPDVPATVKALEERGYPCIFSGSTPGTTFAYVDMTEVLGVIVELVEKPEEEC